MQTSYQFKLKRSDLNLFELSRTIHVTDGDALRNRVITAKLISGPEPVLPKKARESATQNVKNAITPFAQHVKAAAELADRTDTKFRDSSGPNLTGGRLQIPWLAKVLPTQRFKSIGKELLARGDATGGDILRLHDALMTSTERIRTRLENEYTNLNQIFYGMDIEQRRLVKQILEDPAGDLAQGLKKTSPELMEAAIKFRGFLDDLADEVGLDPGDRLENYFSRFYSQRTIEELRKSGIVPSDVSLPLGSGFKEYKFFRSLQDRFAEAPLGEYIDDPLEAGAIYLNGAVRKIHLDPVAAEFGKAYFKQLGRNQPIIGNQMAAATNLSSATRWPAGTSTSSAYPAQITCKPQPTCATSACSSRT